MTQALTDGAATAFPAGATVTVSWTPDGLHLVAGIDMKRWLVFGPVWLWLLAFIALPALIVLALSFSQSAASIPPYDPVITWTGWWPALHVRPDNYQTLVSDDFYLDAALQSLRVAAVSSVCCVLIGYPMALGIARAAEQWRSLLLLLVHAAVLDRVSVADRAWVGLLRDEGWINAALLGLGIIPHADPHALHAIRDVCRHRLLLLAVHGAAALRAPVETRPGAGGSRFRSRCLTLGGVLKGHAAAVVAGCGCRAGVGVHAGDRRIRDPELLGGPSAQTVGRALWNEFFANHDWPMAAALANTLLLGLLAPIALLRLAQRRI